MDGADCVGLIVGIMLGTGIFTVFPTLAAARNPSVFMILLAWVVGTLVALCGAFCFAELTARFPTDGGEYVFLREAFGRNGRSPLSFLFAWAQIMVIRPGSLVSLSIILAVNVGILWRAACQALGRPTTLWAENEFVALVTLATLVFFTLTSLAGVRVSKRVQNAVTVLKVICLAGLIGVGLVLGQGKAAHLTPLFLPSGASIGGVIKNLGIALIPVMWVFGGWNEAPYISADMKDPVRGVPRALILSLVGLGFLYTLINFVYILHLTPAGLASSWTFASDLMKMWFGTGGEVVMASVLILSAAGAVNGLTVTGARMTRAFAADMRMSSGREGDRLSYVRPLLLNLAISLGLAFAVDCAPESIDKLLVFTAGVVWVFFALVAASLFVLRRRRPSEPSPYQLPFYPVTPIVFIVMCGYMLYGAWEYKPVETLCGLGALLLGLPAYWAGWRTLGLFRRRERA